MKPKSLLVIGGSGFVGNSILKYLSNNNFLNIKINKIFILSRRKLKLAIYNKRLKKKLKIIKINSNILTIKSLPKADYVIYAAILSSYEKDHAAVKNYLNLAKKYHSDSKILYISSGAIYGKQLNSISRFRENHLELYKKINFKEGYKKEYSKTKKKNEELFKKFGKTGKKVSIARCFSFVGEYLPLNSHYVVGNIIKNILKNKSITIKANYKIIRSYMYSDDLVRWLLRILDNSNRYCPIYNVGSDDSVSMETLSHWLGKKYNLINSKEKKLRNIVDKYIPNIQKAKKELNLSNNYSSLSAIIKTISILKKK